MVAVDYREGCTGKAGYTTKGKARDAARRAGSRLKKKLHVYPCHHCRLFHLSSMSREEFRRRARDRAAVEDSDPVG